MQGKFDEIRRKKMKLDDKKFRIRSENDGWCPASKISSDSHEYLQIDFDKLTVITLVELQGKHSLKPVIIFNNSNKKK